MAEVDPNLMPEYQPPLEMNNQNHLLNPFRPITVGVGSLATEEVNSNQLVTKQQQVQCGRGPAHFHSRAKISVDGGTEAVKNSWPFFVSRLM